MESYIGETVLVTLRDPPDTQVRGLVSGIVDQQLCLRDVTWLPSQNRMEIFVVDGPENLLDLEILPPAADNTPSLTAPVQPDTDPAILSYVKPPIKKVEHTLSAASGPQGASFSAPMQIQESSNSHHTAPFIAGIPHQSAAQQRPGDTSATLTGPFEDLALNGHFADGHGALNGDLKGGQQEEVQATTKNRRKGKKHHNKGRPADATGQVSAAVKSRQVEPGQNFNATGKQGKKPKGNGWRETPLLEETTDPKPQLLHPQHGSEAESLSRRQLKQLQRSKVEQSGWATEDATDIQEMGDFDFSGNLSKFDKRGVFDQLKQGDTTADEERLVSFNRLPPRLGTAGGKNLHYTENVLSPKAESRGAWSSGDSEADGSQAKISSGRSSRRDMSRASIKKPPSRKGSSITADQHMTGSGSLPESKARARWASRDPSGTMKPQKDHSSSHEVATAGLPASAQSKPSFRIEPSGLFCPCLTPLQMLELEQLAISELGMTEDMITENAARSIAETAVKLILSRRGSVKNDPALNVVVMAGNTKSGARAIAGARQLLNLGASVMLTLLATERKPELLDVVQRQLYLYKKCGGDVTRPDRVGVDGTFKRLHDHPDMVIDAILGMHMSFEDLGISEQERYFGLAKWANERGYVMSIDVPSGLDASSGSLTVVNGTDLVIDANVVLSLGAPKTGLLILMGKDEQLSQITNLVVGGIGISNQAWRKFGTRSKHGIELGPQWVATLRYQAGIE